jgi:hypothetical protein
VVCCATTFAGTSVVGGTKGRLAPTMAVRAAVLVVMGATAAAAEVAQRQCVARTRIA